LAEPERLGGDAAFDGVLEEGLHDELALQVDGASLTTNEVGVQIAGVDDGGERDAEFPAGVGHRGAAGEEFEVPVLQLAGEEEVVRIGDGRRLFRRSVVRFVARWPGF
jgi:hypothetical protein